MCPDTVCIQAERFHDPLLTYEDEDLAWLFGLFVAELTVDNWLPNPWFYLRPVDFAWAVDIIRRAAVECKEREIRRPKLYESLRSTTRGIQFACVKLIVSPPQRARHCPSAGAALRN